MASGSEKNSVISGGMYVRGNGFDSGPKGGKGKGPGANPGYTIYFLNTGALIPAGMAGANVLQ